MATIPVSPNFDGLPYPVLGSNQDFFINMTVNDVKGTYLDAWVTLFNVLVLETNR